MTEQVTSNRAKDILAVLDEKILAQGMDGHPHVVTISLNLVGRIRELIHAYIDQVSRLGNGDKTGKEKP